MAARREYLKKRKYWLKNVLPISSDDDFDELDVAIKPNIDTGQIIALRFPYPMLSDDSDDEEDIKYFPKDLHSFNGEIWNPTYSLDTQRSYKHKKNKKECSLLKRSDCKRKLKVFSNEEDLEQISNCQYEPSSNLKHTFQCSKLNILNNKEHNNMKPCIENNLTKFFHDPLKRGKSQKHHLNKSNQAGDSCEQRSDDESLIYCTSNAQIKDNPESILPLSKQGQHMTKENETTFNGVVSPQISLNTHSRFLNSSSCDSADNNIENVCLKIKQLKSKKRLNANHGHMYKRLHVPSSSSCSDNDEVESDTVKGGQPITNHQNFNKSNRNFLSSSEEEDNESNDLVGKDNTDFQIMNNTSHTAMLIKKHPCYNLIKGLNSTNITKRMEEENDRCEVNNTTTNKIIKMEQPSISNSTNWSYNRNAWNRIGRIKTKQNYETNAKLQLKIKDLKRKFISSNKSSVELHKQIQRKVVNVSTTKHAPSTLKPQTFPRPCMNGGVTSDSNTNGERVQSAGNNYTVNVNVYCRSPQNSGQETIDNAEDQLISPLSNALDASDQTKVILSDKAILHDIYDSTVIPINTKKMRIARVIQDTSVTNKQNKSDVISKKTNKIKNKQTLMIDTTPPVSTQKNVSNECDVLGNILSEMKNNPYKIEKPLKKAVDPTTNLLNWPQNSLFSTSTQKYSPLQSSSVLDHYPAKAEQGISVNKTSVAAKSDNNSDIISNKINSLDLPQDGNLVTKSSQIKQAHPEASNRRDSVIMSFYSANSFEYSHSDTGKVLSSAETPIICEKNNLLGEGVVKGGIYEKGNDNRLSMNQESTALQYSTMKNNQRNIKTHLNPKKGMNSDNVKTRFKKKDANEVCASKSKIKSPKGAPVTEISTSISTDKTDKINDDSLTKNTDDSTKGIRIRLGGTIFRLPGKIGPSSDKIFVEDLKKDNEISSKYAKVGNVSTCSTLITPREDITTCSSDCNKDTPTLYSEGPETSSESSNTMDETSSSSTGSSMDSNITSNRRYSTGRITDVSNDLKCTEIKGSIKIVCPLEPINNNLSNSVHVNKVINDVIVLSDSSDNENRNSYDKDEKCKSPTCTPKQTPNKEFHNVPLIKDSDSSNSMIKINSFGKIRVRSLKDLGVSVDKPLPENALPNIPLKIPPIQKVNVCKVVTNKQLVGTSDVQRKQGGVPIPDVNTSDNQISQTTDHGESNLNKLDQLLNSSCAQLKQSKEVPKEGAEYTLFSHIPQSSPKQVNADCSNQFPNVEEPDSNQVLELQSQRQTDTRHISPTEIDRHFFHSYNELFIELVYLKIPKLVDDLHLLIIHDKFREERLKKLEQLISPETKAAEKRRTEKDFSDAVKLRSQSFVPLFMTIVNKISKDNVTTLIIAFYIRIVQQLLHIDPNHLHYKFKLKNIIKCLLEKHSSPGIEKVSFIFNYDDHIFQFYYHYIEQLLLKYDSILENPQRNILQQNCSLSNTTSTSVQSKTVNKCVTTMGADVDRRYTDKIIQDHVPSEIPVIIVAPPKNPSAVVRTDNLQTPTLTTSVNILSNPLIGDLDSLIFKKGK